MSDVSQQISIRLNKGLGDALSNINTAKLRDKLAELIVKLVIERTQAGYDVYSRRFGGYNKSYDKKQSYKYAARKYGTTEYSSSSTGDKLQLTGNLLSSIKSNKGRISVSKNGIFITFKVAVTGSKNLRKAEGLQSTTGHTRNGRRYAKKAFVFMGLAISGSYVTKETNAIQDLIIKLVREKTKIKVTKR